MSVLLDLSDGRQLLGRCDAGYEPLARSLLQAVAARQQVAPGLLPGSLIDAGWALLQLRPVDDRTLEVCEPDYGREPLDWVGGLDRSLAIMDAQAAWVRLLDVGPQRTRFDQTLRLAPGTLSSPDVFLARLAPRAPGDSGWQVRVDRPREAAAPSVSRDIAAGEFVLRKPAWPALLALPTGFVVELHDGHIVRVMDEHDHLVFPVGESRLA